MMLFPLALSALPQLVKDKICVSSQGRKFGSGCEFARGENNGGALNVRLCSLCSYIDIFVPMQRLPKQPTSTHRYQLAGHGACFPEATRLLLQVSGVLCESARGMQEVIPYLLASFHLMLSCFGLQRVHRYELSISYRY